MINVQRKLTTAEYLHAKSHVPIISGNQLITSCVVSKRATSELF